MESKEWISRLHTKYRKIVEKYKDMKNYFYLNDFPNDDFRKPLEDYTPLEDGSLDYTPNIGRYLESLLELLIKTGELRDYFKGLSPNGVHQ